MKSRKKFLGRYVMQDVLMHIYFDPDSAAGGDAHFAWHKDGFVRVTIGGKDHTWGEVLGTALHELLEISFRLSKASFSPDFNLLQRRDTGRFRFFMDHDQFTEAVQHVAYVMVFLAPDLSAAYNKKEKAK